MENKQREIIKQIEKRLSEHINIVEIDDITGERKNSFTKLAYLAKFEVSGLMGLISNAIERID